MTRTSSNITEDESQHSPFRGPDWRWRAARESHCTSIPLRKIKEPQIRSTVRFLIDCLSATNDPRQQHSVSCRWPELAQALSIYLESGEKRHEIEARLLCQPVALISDKTGIPIETLVIYARVFFDVLDIEPVTDWLIYDAAKVGEWLRRLPTEAEIWKYFAILRGPAILELLIEDWRSRPSPEMAERHLLAKKARFLARDFAAQLRLGPIMNRQMLAERRKLFGDVDRRRSREDPAFALHLRFVEMLAPSMRRKPVAGAPGIATLRKTQIAKNRRNMNVVKDSPTTPPSEQQSPAPEPQEHSLEVA